MEKNQIMLPSKKGKKKIITKEQHTVAKNEYLKKEKKKKNHQ